MTKKLRPVLSVGLLIIALGVAGVYLNSHRLLLTQLKHIPLTTGLLVLVLYMVLLVVLMLKLSATLKVCNINLKTAENAKLNANTLLINFFLPGQGGPVYNGYYLLKKHRLKIKNFLLVSLLYYVIYAVLSVCLLLGSVRPWWQTLLAVVLVAAAGFFATRRYMGKKQIDKQSLNLSPQALSILTLATALQIIIQLLIYMVELHSVKHHISLSQVVTYTGAANLTMFVALTPGAIGIRESFLIFTEHLNHLSSANIVLANVIDRSVYLLFLVIIIIVTAAFHANTWSSRNQKNNLKVKEKVINVN